MNISLNLLKKIERENKPVPFVCSVGDCTLIVRYEEKYETHIFTDKNDKSKNWTEQISYV
jgi:hypothetical protein